MKKNKFTTYLLYAIGEIVLVVIGILIAVSLNNWNEQRKSAQEATNQLKKIKDDLLADQQKLRGEIEVNDRLIAELIFCVNVLTQDQTATKKEFLNHFEPMTITGAFLPTNGAFQGLISSGKIQLIEDENMLNALLSYYNTTEYQGWDSSIKDYSRNVIAPYLLNFDHTPNPTNRNHRSNYTQFDLSKFKAPGKTLEDYRNDLFILNSIRIKIELFEGRKAAYINLESKLSSLLQLFDSDVH